jgi:hypothetical protein
VLLRDVLVRREMEYLTVVRSTRLAKRGRRVARELERIPAPISTIDITVRGLTVSWGC